MNFALFLQEKPLQVQKEYLGLFRGTTVCTNYVVFM